jgi:broad specificity phosphatase PhoE
MWISRTIVALAAAAVLGGCGTSATVPTPGVVAGGATPSVRAVPAPVPGEQAPRRIVMVIRHGEKPDDDASGVDANGVADDSSLNSAGWDRARRLVDLFDPAHGAVRPGLARPVAVYAAGANDEGEGKRTRETVEPLAERLGITVDHRFGKGDEEKLVEHVLAGPWSTLISWQHGEIPAIAEAFPRVTPAPPKEWPDDRFDVVWIFTETATGWTFTQQPELVLPQDRPDVIED